MPGLRAGRARRPGTRQRGRRLVFRAGPYDSSRGTMLAGGGAVAEWLGRGLQSLVHRFESGPRL
jgi:hypothetical protein